MGPFSNSPSYYLGLITSEYQASPNILAWTSANIQLFQDATVCLAQMITAFNLNTAVGPQLDILGAILGQGRTVGFQPTGGVSPVLDDTSYRTLLLSKVLQNHWDGRIDSLKALWSVIFPGGSITIADNQNMTATVILSGIFTSIIQDLIMNGYIVPRPQAVQYTYVFPALPILGFDENTAFIAGLDLGKFI